MADEKERIEEKAVEKKEEKQTWYHNIPPTFLVIGLLIITWAMISMMNFPESKNKMMIIIVVVIVGLFLLSKYAIPKTGPLSPQEAIYLARQDFELKKKNGEFGMMTIPKIGPIVNDQNRQGRGMFYDINCTINEPYSLSKYFVIKVRMEGDRRGFVHWIKVDTPIYGDEKEQEVDVFHPMMERLSKQSRYDILARVMEDTMKGKRIL